MVSHTPGPCQFCNAGLDALMADGTWLYQCGTCYLDGDTRMGRVCAIRRLQVVEDQRDRLLEACEALLDAVSDLGDEAREEFSESAVNKAIAAIAAAKGEANG